MREILDSIKTMKTEFLKTNEVTAATDDMDVYAPCSEVPKKSSIWIFNLNWFQTNLTG
jgi:hypothetical protein